MMRMVVFVRELRYQTRVRNYTDIQILQGLLNNSDKMIQYVFYSHFTSLLRFNAMKAAGSKEVELEDLIQELYLYLSRNNWEKLRRYNPDMPFANWFSVVSYRFFKDFTASMIDSTVKVPISDMNEHSLSQVGTGKTETVMMDIKQAIAKLEPPRDREIVEALVLNEEEPAEVAQRFKVTVDNLYNIKRRAIIKLIQKHLQEYVN